jgi:hypothetical protein
MGTVGSGIHSYKVDIWWLCWGTAFSTVCLLPFLLGRTAAALESAGCCEKYCAHPPLIKINCFREMSLVYEPNFNIALLYVAGPISLILFKKLQNMKNSEH